MSHVLKSPLLLVSLALMIVAPNANAAWTTVGTGIEYQAFTVPSDPNNLFVCRMARNNPNTTIDTTIGGGVLTGGLEVISSQSSRVNDAINWWGDLGKPGGQAYWGARNKVVVAINGEMTGASTSGGIQNGGWQARQYGAFGGFSGFGWTTGRVPFIGGCVWERPENQFVVFQPSGTQVNFDGVNGTRASGQFIIYTPQYAVKTPTVSTGAEVLVQLPQPMVIARGADCTVGTVLQVWQNSGAHSIPFDCVIMSADGTKGTQLYNSAVVGQTVSISQYTTDYNEPDTCGANGCSYGTGLDWSFTYAAVGVNYKFVENGVVRPPDAVCHPGYIGDVNLNPRTIIAYNADYVYFVVCDGRTSSSIGMGLEELGHWCVDNLQATDAVNLDGGGSSEMIVNGVIKNHPSGGSERAVVNGMVMVNVMPKTQSSAFSAGQSVTTNVSSVALRHGPGSNYGSIVTLPKNTVLTVVDNALNGVYAKGYNWWKIQVSTLTGWVQESQLYNGTSSVAISQQPTDQLAYPGNSVAFSVTATGSGALTFQWQKNSASISNGGHYSCVDTAMLVISNIDASDAGNYRCVVTGPSNGATSNSAALTVITSPPATPTDGTPTVNSTTSITWRWNDVATETGYRVKDTAGINRSGNLAANTVSWTESPLTPNTQYTRKVYAFNGLGESGGSTGRTKYTLAKAGESTDGTGNTGNVYCTSASKSTWYAGSKTFVFSNPAGFGTGGAWKASAFEHKWNKVATETWSSSGTSWTSGTISLTANSGDGDYYLHVRAFNGDGAANNTDVLNYGPFKSDATPPSAITVTDEGTWTPTNTTLKANWTAATDASSGLNRYEYAIGTSPTTQDIRSWTSNGTSTNLTATGLTLVDGTWYYIQARAVDNVGNPTAGASADGVKPVAGVSPISYAWAKANGDPFSLRNKLVTAALPGAFWLEETNRTMGIKVVWDYPVAKGNTVSVAGVLGASGTQRALIGDVVINSGGSTTIAPLGVNQKALGGGDFNTNTPGVTDGAGLYNIGLLVKCCGNVTYSNTDNPSNKYFFLDDGSPRWAGVSYPGSSGYPGPSGAGVLVRCGSVEPPSSGMRMVTGIVASEQSGSDVVPVILIRDSGDITPL